MRRVLVLGALLLALAACGDSDDGDGVATAGGEKESGGTEQQVDEDEARQKFAECMREHGIDMPDPEPGKPPRMQYRGDRDKMDKAMDACRDLLPNGGDFTPNTEQLEAMRELAKCMRDNGVPEFPDPDPNGGGIRIGQDSGIDLDDPDFKAAQEKCRDKLPERPERQR
jgi:hypothetical protein